MGKKNKKAEEKPNDIAKLVLRVGKIVDVGIHPDADSMYVEKIDLGEESGPRTIVSGLRKDLTMDQLNGAMVIVLANLKPAPLRGVLSNGMVLVAKNESGLELLQPPAGAKPGERVGIEDLAPSEQLPASDSNILDIKKK